MKGREKRLKIHRCGSSTPRLETIDPWQSLLLYCFLHTDACSQRCIDKSVQISVDCFQLCTQKKKNPLILHRWIVFTLLEQFIRDVLSEYL